MENESLYYRIYYKIQASLMSYLDEPQEQINHKARQLADTLHAIYLKDKHES